jgi:hypothetical protein
LISHHENSFLAITLSFGKRCPALQILEEGGFVAELFEARIAAQPASGKRSVTRGPAGAGPDSGGAVIRAALWLFVLFRR